MNTSVQCPYHAMRGLTNLDPYPVYAEALAAAPIHWDESFGGWAVFNFAECNRILVDVKSFPMPWTVFEGGIAALGRYGLYNIEGEEHKAVHKYLMDFFNTTRNTALQPAVEKAVAQAFAHAAGQGPVDFYKVVAQSIPNAMALDFLGLPGDEDTMAVVYLGVQRLLRYIETMGEDPVALRDLLDIHQKLAQAWSPALEERRRSPKNDIVSYLVGLETTKPDCAPNEVVAQCLFFFTASLSNTANAIANAVWAYLTSPRWRAELPRRPEAITTFVEETLRVWAAVQFRVRMAAHDMEIAGQPVKRGERIIIVVGAGNRDGAKFDRADEIDIDRKDSAQLLTFGRGVRYCAGAPLAKMEVQEVIRTLASGQYQVELLEPPTRFDGLNYRNWSPLMVRID